MSLNFADIAKTKIEEIERPANAPVGTYVFQITKVPEMTTSQDGNWDIINIPCVAVEATDNVDPEDLRNFGAIKNIRQSYRFMFNKQDKAAFESTVFRLKTFLESHVRCTADGMDLSQSLNASVNQRFLGELSWRPDKNNPEIIYTEIKRTAPIE